MKKHSFLSILAVLSVLVTGCSKGADKVESILTSVATTIASNVTNESGTGALCLNVVSEDGVETPSECSFDFLQMKEDPKPAKDPEGACSEKGQYYFANIPSGRFDIVANCGGRRQSGSIQISADEVTRLDEVIPGGGLCVNKLGLSIDPENTSEDMSRYLGYGSDEDCVAATAQQVATMTTVNIVQYDGPGTCKGMADSDCSIAVQGLTVSMKNGFTGYKTDEKRKFDITVTDGKSRTHVYVVTKNGKVWR